MIRGSKLQVLDENGLKTKMQSSFSASKPWDSKLHVLDENENGWFSKLFLMIDRNLIIPTSCLESVGFRKLKFRLFLKIKLNLREILGSFSFRFQHRSLETLNFRSSMKTKRPYFRNFLYKHYKKSYHTSEVKRL